MSSTRKIKFGCVSCRALLLGLWHVLCFFSCLRVHNPGARQVCSDLHVPRGKVEIGGRLAAMLFRKNFHGILARILVPVGSNFLHGIGALVLMHESGIR